ncbi:MAG: 2-amino-4-hydroxy-6-hydroxymethyldihydropteridine diphosphokinase [Candidatus Nanopelagicales bacterium]|nr:2-amino-4-hydroxy-6-hydroxymethyldihydropteridine diphosphokinase [Candidatus Nanopelagicales bacterium]
MTTPVPRAALSIGSNVGDRVAALRRAVQALAAVPGTSLARVSSLYETEPVGGPVQPAFLNAVVTVELAPGPSLRALASRLLEAGQQAERDLSRAREIRWGPRTLDVDVLAVGDLVSADERLTIPHPRISERAFVLVPWAEVDESFVVVGLGSVAALLAALPSGARGAARQWEGGGSDWWVLSPPSG